MTSRYLLKLDAEIDLECDRAVIGALKARKAAYLARIGDFSDATNLVERVRSEALADQLHSVAIHAIFVDGIIAFYKDLLLVARDKWRRARSLSLACGATSILANVEAWLAHDAFGRFALADMCTSLGSAIQHVALNDSDCLARIFLVIAQASHLAGDKEMANKWYERSRVKALVLGDDVAISSLMYNRTAMDVACLRQKLLSMGIRGVGGEDANLIAMKAESTDNFDRLIGIVSLGDFTPNLVAQTYSLAERFLEAEMIYSSSLSSLPSPAQRRHRGWLVADRAYCLARLGRITDARYFAEEAKRYVTNEDQVDDVAAMYSRISLVASMCGDMTWAEESRIYAIQCWAEFSGFQAKLMELCAKFDLEAERVLCH